VKRLAIISALVALAALGVFASVALADKPPSPPGQGPCEHGNSQKPCKDDPQPDKGKDCEEHGPKNGGVNEDHCKGETEPPVTTTEPPVTTTPEPPHTNPDPPGKPPVVIPPDGGVIVLPPPVKPPAAKPPVVPVVEQEDLEEQLEEQAQENGATAAPSGHVTASDELPYTGLGLRWIVLLGSSLVGSGLWLRRRSS